MKLRFLYLGGRQPSPARGLKENGFKPGIEFSYWTGVRNKKISRTFLNTGGRLFWLAVVVLYQLPNGNKTVPLESLNPRGARQSVYLNGVRRYGSSTEGQVRASVNEKTC